MFVNIHTYRIAPYYILYVYFIEDFWAFKNLKYSYEYATMGHCSKGYKH
jgi:hypothetical protein